MLPAGGIDHLAEIAFLIQQPDADDRHTEIARRLQIIAREHAEPAGIERQRLAEAEFHAEIGDPDRAAAPWVAANQPGVLEIGAPAATEPSSSATKRGIGGKRPQPLGRDVLQDRSRDCACAAKIGVDPLPQRVGFVAPGPAQIERQLASASSPAGSSRVGNAGIAMPSPQGGGEEDWYSSPIPGRSKGKPSATPPEQAIGSADQMTSRNLGTSLTRKSHKNVPTLDLLAPRQTRPPPGVRR